MTRKEIESGKGRYTTGGTCIIQRGSDDFFDTVPQGSGWSLRAGWHIAGKYAGRRVEWCDMW